MTECIARENEFRTWFVIRSLANKPTKPCGQIPRHGNPIRIDSCLSACGFDTMRVSWLLAKPLRPLVFHNLTYSFGQLWIVIACHLSKYCNGLSLLATYSHNAQHEQTTCHKPSSRNVDRGSFEIMSSWLALSVPHAAATELRTLIPLVSNIIKPEFELDNKFPSRVYIQRAMIKLDLLHSLSRRRLFDDETIHVARFWGTDGSPQNKANYQETVFMLFVWARDDSTHTHSTYRIRT